MEKSIDETILEKPIQDRLRQASHITVESALRNKVNLNISWYNIHGEQQSQKYTIAAGTMIEF
jgi:low affinity Fe/Cu permease